MELEIRLRSIFAGLFLLIFLEFSAYGRVLRSPKPDIHNAAASSRWLVAQNTWGVLSTVSINMGGSPFGNVVSFSDGLPDKGSGVPYFYLTTMDPTARNALKDKRASLTVSEYPLGTCKMDPMDPTCSKLTLTGKLLPLEKGSKETEFAQEALFTKHPEMKDWPKDHDFRFFKLDISDIFLINWYGGAKPVTVEEYFHPKSTELASSL